jgi:hypothetical protein
MYTLTKPEQQHVETAVANLVRDLHHSVISDYNPDHGNSGGSARGHQDAVTDAVAALIIREVLQKYDTSLGELGLLESGPAPLVDRLLG